MSTPGGYCGNDLIREAWALERYTGGVAREGFVGGRGLGNPVLELGKQAGICCVIEFGCSRERRQRGQSCEWMTCSRTSREEGDCRKGSETLGLCPEGDADPGLNQGCDQGPSVVVGGGWAVRGPAVILPDPSPDGGWGWRT